MKKEGSEWTVSLLLPFSIIIGQGIFGAALYGQILSFSFFLFSLGLFFRGRKKLSTAVLFLSLVSHFWTGIILYGILGIYIIIYENWQDNLVLSIPIVILVPLLPHDAFSFIDQAISGGKNTAYILDKIADINIGLIFFGITGVYYSKRIWSRDFSNFFLIYLSIFFILFVLFFERAWRITLLVPVLFFALGGSKKIW